MSALLGREHLRRTTEISSKDTALDSQDKTQLFGAGESQRPPPVGLGPVGSSTVIEHGIAPDDEFDDEFLANLEKDGSSGNKKLILTRTEMRRCRISC